MMEGQEVAGLLVGFGMMTAVKARRFLKLCSSLPVCCVGLSVSYDACLAGCFTARLRGCAASGMTARRKSEVALFNTHRPCTCLPLRCPSTAHTHPPTHSRLIGRAHSYFVVASSNPKEGSSKTTSDEEGRASTKRTCFQHQQQRQHNTTTISHARPPPATAAWSSFRPSSRERGLCFAPFAPIITLYLPKPLQPRSRHFQHEQALGRLPRQPAPRQEPATTSKRRCLVG